MNVMLSSTQIRLGEDQLIFQLATTLIRRETLGVEREHDRE